MDIIVPYAPHAKQSLVHGDSHRFRIVAAGRRFGKTVLALNELVKVALENPNRRSWYLGPTFRAVKDFAWSDPKSGIFSFLPKQYILKTSQTELSIRLTNGHLIQFKGAENKHKLRGVGLVFVVLDEFGQMSDDMWNTIIRPMLADQGGKALFIGTPQQGISTNFHDLWKLGQSNDPDYKSWQFKSSDNTAEPRMVAEMEDARKRLPPEDYRREWEADFVSSDGLVFNNFDVGVNIIPGYEPGDNDCVVGSIDPGLVNETAALLVAWDRRGCGRAFKEYYQKGFLADENAESIAALAKPYKVSYWVIDRAALKRDPRSGLTVYDSYAKLLHPLACSKNDPGSVIYSINECKRLLQAHETTREAGFYVSSELTHFIYEIEHYLWYTPKWETRRNLPEKPRKYKDHLIDCWKNMILTRPWINRDMKPIVYAKGGRTQYTGY